MLLFFALIMLFDDFSLFRLIGFVIVLALPILLKKLIFNKFFKSLLCWVVTYLLFFILISVTDTREITQENSQNISIYKENDVTVSVLEGILPDDETIDVSKVKNPKTEDIDGVAFYTYEISLPNKTVMEGVAEIKIPYDEEQFSSDIDATDAISAAYFDEQESKWLAVPYTVDSKEKVVTIYTNHFSKYAVVYFKDGRKKLSDKLPKFDSMPTSLYSVSDMEKILGEIEKGTGESSTALSAGWNSFNSYYGLTSASESILSTAVSSKTLTSINSLMTEAGVGFAFAQLAYDLSNGDNNAAVNNLIKNSSYYSASKWGGTAIGLASAGATFMDVAINKYAETALDKNLQKWEDSYRYYYFTNPKATRSAVEWYKIVSQLHKSSENPEEFKNKLDSAITDYCDIFWKDPEAYAYIAEKTPGKIGFGAGGEYANDVSTISDRFKDFIYANTIKSVMEVYTKNLWIEESIKSDKKLQKLKDEMNKEYTVTVNLSNYQQVKNIKGTMVRLKNGDGKVIHSQSFDTSGKAIIKMSLLGFLKAGGPVNIEVKVPEQDNTPAYKTTLTYKLDSTNIVLNAPYTPVITSQETKKAVEESTPTETKKPEQKSTPQKKPNNQTPAATNTPAVVQPPVTTPKSEYNYNAALAAWSAALAAKENSKTFDDGTCKTTCQFEWVTAPYIKDGQVYGASKLWYNNQYYSGAKAGTTEKYVASEMYDANNPGVLISLADLKKAYPQFGN
jgi:hypothetical protein